MILRKMMRTAQRASSRGARAAAIEGGDWDLMDFRTGKMLTAGSETESGVPLDAETAYSYHAWYRAISLIAQKSAAVPKLLHKAIPGDKGRERITDHIVASLVAWRANEEQTAFQFWLQMAGHVASRGNGYAVAVDFIQSHAKLYGLSTGDVATLRFRGESVSRRSGLRMVRVDQTVHGLPLPEFGHRVKFGNDPKKHLDFSAVTHVARGKGIPPFLILYVAGHPDVAAQAQ